MNYPFSIVMGRDHNLRNRLNMALCHMYRPLAKVDTSDEMVVSNSNGFLSTVLACALGCVASQLPLPLA